MASYTVQASGVAVVFGVRQSDPAGASNHDHYLLSVAEARDIATDLIEAAETAEKAGAKARADRTATLRNEITRLVAELNEIEGPGTKTFVGGIDFAKEH